MKQIREAIRDITKNYKINDNYTLTSKISNLISDFGNASYFCSECEIKGLKLHIEIEDQNYSDNKGEVFKIIIDIETGQTVIIGNLNNYSMFRDLEEILNFSDMK